MDHRIGVGYFINSGQFQFCSRIWPRVIYPQQGAANAPETVDSETHHESVEDHILDRGDHAVSGQTKVLKQCCGWR